MNKWWEGTPNFNPWSSGITYLFPHWTDGDTLEGAVATLQNPARQASANYVIQDDRVAQLVSERHTSWHCSNGYYNTRSISYELVGRPGNPPTRATLDTCAEMMAQASRDYFGGARLVLGENVMLHRMVYATSCPGDTDITYLLTKANQILAGEDDDMPTPEELWNYPITDPSGDTYPAYQHLSWGRHYAKSAAKDVWNEPIPEPHSDNKYPAWQMLTWDRYYAMQQGAQIDALTEAVKALAGMQGGDPEAVVKAVADAVGRKLESIKVEVTTDV